MPPPHHACHVPRLLEATDTDDRGASVDVEAGRTLNDVAPGAELWRRSRDDEVAVHDDEDVAQAAREGYIVLGG